MVSGSTLSIRSSWSQRAAWFITFVCCERVLRMMVGVDRDTGRHCLVFSFSSVRRLVCLRAQTCSPLRCVWRVCGVKGATGLAPLTAEGVNWAIVPGIWGRREAAQGSALGKWGRENGRDGSIGCQRYATGNSGNWTHVGMLELNIN